MTIDAAVFIMLSCPCIMITLSVTNAYTEELNRDNNWRTEWKIGKRAIRVKKRSIPYR